MSQYPYPEPSSPPTPVVKVPSLGWTLVVTFLFGLFGLIPAFIHTAKARDLGAPTTKYWVTFGCVMAVNIVLFALLVAGSK